MTFDFALALISCLRVEGFVFGFFGFGLDLAAVVLVDDELFKGLGSKCLRTETRARADRGNYAVVRSWERS